ncbi:MULTISPECIES: GntR family transcriptional regulator [unclassified Halomonas]|uniref:GntR family transcriptional regulator n=1 Tax=unclassified Halomonas TaxID=2609666 RepID=UPI0007D9092E|nr:MULTISPECIES: GntR family transcriptional regulator [unclassified Halomonas]MBT2786474.1 GntR family transcriptional regulator [Halomonas sp. ISL-106]MBT2797496.1 GntR family transcriptional regulator [Halomonas sp. ISL-104]OAL58856.1 UbiC transcription regulator-associated protein [Halomonas sp. ALS9]
MQSRFTADTDGRLPLYAKLRDQLGSRIANGEWKPGDMIPSENRLAEEYGVALATMRMALKQLVDEGLLDRRRGTGTFVKQPAFRADLFRFFHVHDVDDPDIPVIPESRILSCQEVPLPPEVQKAFGADSASHCIKLERVRLWSGEPMLFEEVYLRLPDFEELLSLNLKTMGPLLYPVFLEKFGILISSATDELSFGIATETSAKQLELASEAPVAVIQRIARNPAGRVIEFRRVHGRPERFRYRVTLGDQPA